MTRGGNPLAYRRLRAPREDRTALIEPPWSDVAAAVETNRRLRGSVAVDIGGVALPALAQQARHELLAEAARYTATYLDPPPEIPVAQPPPAVRDSAEVSSAMPGPAGLSSSAARGDALPSRGRLGHSPDPLVFLAGHQPQLFHPGVWFKNFALDDLAKRHGAIAVNLVVDSDTVRSHAVRVPGGTAANPQSTAIPLDGPGPVVPFEERRVLDRTLFSSFGERAADQIASLVADPLVRDYWPRAVARLGWTGNLGACLAQSRHQVERRLGLRTLEIPQSRVCQLPSFARFTAFLLAELPRLVAVYNEVVHEYRRIHRIRSNAHPVPDLAVEEPWWEAPYWIWTREDPRRRRLFVGRRGRQLLLSDRHALEIPIELGPDGDADRAVDAILALAGRGVRLRSRALVTTLFARLILGDLFLHGIGGAKYDQVTDAIVERFFGLEPPGFLVLSATLLLPVARPRVTPETARQIARQLRDLDYHPDAVLDGVAQASQPVAPVAQASQPVDPSEASALIAAKRRWIATPPSPGNVRTRWREIRRINAALQPFVSGRRQELLRRQSETASALAAETILSWREYAFCLYPERMLRECFAALLPER